MFARLSPVFLALAVLSLVAAQDSITANSEMQLVEAGGYARALTLPALSQCVPPSTPTEFRSATGVRKSTLRH